MHHRVGSRRFSSTVISAMTPRPSGTWETPRRAMLSTAFPISSSPAKRIVPARGFTSPLMVRSNVVFPAPLAPRTAVIEPGRAENVTDLRASTAP